MTAYKVPRPEIPVDLVLDGNEGRAPPASLLEVLGEPGQALLNRYPDARGLEAAAAEVYGVDPSFVLVTAGADDAFERVIRAVVGPGRQMVVPEPTFSMIDRFVALAGGALVSIPWEEHGYPTEAVLGRLGPQTGAVAVVSPNNPTGGVATREDVERLALAAPHALVVVDHAYVEIGGEDLTSLAAELPNVVVLRTLSKAWGLAGLRVGFALASPRILGWLRTTGHPYAVSGPSVALATRWLAVGREVMEAYVARVQKERQEIGAALTALGGLVPPSEGNFAFARVPDPLWLRDGLAGLGIGIRAFPGDPLLDDAVRITCPGDAAEEARVLHALATLSRPEALLFDMDGVIVDVSQSYREAIRLTAAHFGVEVTREAITREKERGHGSNDWLLTQRLLADRGVEASLAEVTDVFERLYQGTEGVPGLRQREDLLIPRELLAELRGRLPLGIVTGRPRSDAERFLDERGIRDLFDAVVVMEDAPAKPDPAPVRLALSRLGVRLAWMVGDTPDDIRAARGAAVLPLGAQFGSAGGGAGGDSGGDVGGDAGGEAGGEVGGSAGCDAGGDAGALALTRAGAALVLTRPQELKERLP